MGLTARFSNPVSPGQSPETKSDLAECDQYVIESGQIGRQKQVRLGEREVLKLVSQYIEGLSVPELVERWGVHRTTVLDHLERQGVPRRATKRRLSDAQVAEAAELYRAGSSLASLGRQFRVSATTMSKELKAVGVPSRSPR